MHNQAVNLTIHLKLQLDLIYNFHWRLCYYMLRIYALPTIICIFKFYFKKIGGFYNSLTVYPGG